MSEQQINLGQIVGKDHKYQLSLSNESPEDAAARRTREATDAELKRKMTFVLFLFALVATGASGCVYVFASGSPEDKSGRHRQRNRVRTSRLPGRAGKEVGARTKFA